MFGCFSEAEYSAYLSRIERADERTRTAYPCSLRVRGQWLPSVAQACRTRKGKGSSVPCVAHNGTYCVRVRVKLGSTGALGAQKSQLVTSRSPYLSHLSMVGEKSSW
jgi:hypothetical protein